MSRYQSQYSRRCALAVGVPENEVFAAADAVLARGERPTVERVRKELGRGSPARVGSLLDQWWTRLANRLSSETRLPELPAQVAQAFVAVWQQAIHLAQGAADQTLDEQRQVLNVERERVAAVEDQARHDAAQFRQQATEAVVARLLVETRLADLELLLDQRRTQIDDLHQQRDGLVRERDEAQQQTQQLQLKAEQDRVTQETYMRGVEDRAHREIDRAREESKDGARKNKELAQQVELLQRRLDTKQEELALAQQYAVAQQSRADTLEAQLLRQSKPTPAKTRAKKTRGGISVR